VIDSATINVPGPGKVLALASTCFYTRHTYGDDPWTMYGISKSSAEFDPAVFLNWTFDDFLNSGDYYEPASFHMVFSVPATGTYTYYFIAKRIGDDAVRADWHVLSLIYLPTAYGTVEKGSPDVVAMPPFREREGTDRTGTVDQSQLDLASELNALRAKLEVLEKKIKETMK
jgi:hypothetical protein